MIWLAAAAVAAVIYADGVHYDDDGVVAWVCGRPATWADGTPVDPAVLDGHDPHVTYRRGEFGRLKLRGVHTFTDEPRRQPDGVIYVQWWDWSDDLPDLPPESCGAQEVPTS